MDFVKEVAGKGYFSGSTQIDQEIDIEIIIHIEKVNKKSYLTVQLGKHRLTTVAPDKDRYAVLEMHDVGGLWDDYGKADTTLLKVGGGAIGSADQNPFWESI